MKCKTALYFALLALPFAPCTSSAQSLLENLLDIGRLPYLKNSNLIQISSHDTTGGNADMLRIRAGEKAVLADIPGPGVITRIWVTIASTDKYFLRRILLRMYWDGESEPSVEVPVGDFFGTGFEYTHYLAYLVGMSSGGYYSYFPMPFARSARVEVENQTGADIGAFYYHIDYQKMNALDDNVGYFHAQWHREPRPDRGKPYTILEAEGQGHFVGCNLQMQGYSNNLWFLEGDELVYVDGEPIASIRGTGTEDYFTSGWYFNRGTYAGPFHGCILKDEKTSRVVAYRFHIGDAIPFQKSIHVTIEHGHGNEEIADYSSVAYWYQREPHRKFAEILPAPARIPLRVLVPVAGLEGEGLNYETSQPPRVSLQRMTPFGAEWSASHQLRFDAQKPGDEITLEVPVQEEDRYFVKAYLTQGPEYGKVRAIYAGQPMGTDVDGYSTETLPRAVDLGKLSLTKGMQRLTFRLVGKNEKSSGYALGIDKILLMPVRDFIRDWYVIGPFDNPRGEKDTEGLRVVYPPEKETRLAVAYPGKDSQPVRWKFQRVPESGFVDFNQLFTPNDYTVAYALSYVYSPNERKTAIFLGSDDGVRVWLNGLLVHDKLVKRAAVPDQDTVAVTLKPGWNKLLVKVEEAGGDWGFFLRIPNPKEELRFAAKRR